MTHGTKPEPPAERLRNVLALLISAQQSRPGSLELVRLQVRDLAWMADKLAGVLAELEASTLVPATQELRPGFVYRERCPRCGYCYDEFLKQEDPPVLNLAERGARQCPPS
jgi:hypothetical protein